VRHRWVAALCLVALTAPGCAGSSSEEAAPPTTLTNAVPLERETGTPTRLHLTGIDDNGTKPPPDGVVGAVTWTLDRWFVEAVLDPLRTGQPVPDETLAALFTPVAFERVKTDDRGALTDEGLPSTATNLAAEAATVALSSVAGPDEVPAVIVAKIELRLHATGPQLDADVVREGELVLVPTEHGWRIDGYDLRTTRQSR
jgi:hypothetical protein